ncbi:MAG: hypothetical protein AAF270_06895 [Pseudomonadota bacterium]
MATHGHTGTVGISATRAFTIIGNGMVAPSDPEKHFPRDHGRSYPDGCNVIVDPSREPALGHECVYEDITDGQKYFGRVTGQGLLSTLDGSWQRELSDSMAFVGAVVRVGYNIGS